MGRVFLGPPRNRKTMNECSLSQAKRRLVVHTVMEKAITGDKFTNDLRDRMGQVIHFYTVANTNPGFWKPFSLKQIFQNHVMKDEFLTVPWTSHLSHHLHPFIPTWVNGCCLHSPYIPGILQLLQKGDQVQFRDKTCWSEKGIFVLLQIHQYRIQYYSG